MTKNNHKQMKYNGIYSDKFGTTEIVIENDFKTLTFEVDGVMFRGSEFSDFSVVDKTKYSIRQLERFTFYSTPIYQSEEVVSELCDCTITLTTPQAIIDIEENIVFYTDMQIECLLGKELPKPKGELESEKVNVTIKIKDKVYSESSDLIEIALDKINRQIGDKYKFRNCYGCMYGDYSVYGQSGFGTMLCFVGQKDKYLQVKDKFDYLNLEANYSQVQEIYCCDRFEIRKNGIGYR